MIHYDSTVSVVDFCVNAGITNKVDDPLFPFILIEAETGREISERSINFVVE